MNEEQNTAPLKETMNVGCYLDTADDWSSAIWNAGWRRLVSQLPAGVLEWSQKEHPCNVEALKTADWIWLDVPILLTVGAKR